MTKYKINRDPDSKVPTKDQIEKFKNFRRLTANYDQFTKRPKLAINKNKRLFLALILIGLIAYLLSMA